MRRCVLFVEELERGFRGAGSAVAFVNHVKLHVHEGGDLTVRAEGRPVGPAFQLGLTAGCRAIDLGYGWYVGRIDLTSFGRGPAGYGPYPQNSRIAKKERALRSGQVPRTEVDDILEIQCTMVRCGLSFALGSDSRSAPFDFGKMTLQLGQLFLIDAPHYVTSHRPLQHLIRLADAVFALFAMRHVRKECRDFPGNGK